MNFKRAVAMATKERNAAARNQSMGGEGKGRRRQRNDCQGNKNLQNFWCIPLPIIPLPVLSWAGNVGKKHGRKNVFPGPGTTSVAMIPLTIIPLTMDFLFGKISPRISRISRMENPSLFIRVIRAIRGCISLVAARRSAFLAFHCGS
jgi:hypothetical protein